MATTETLQSLYRNLRRQTLRLTENLSAEDMVVQSMPEASPTKWHLGHTTWFFETFILCEHSPGYRRFEASFNYLFNSYYDMIGERHPRPERGLLTRPGLADVLEYRDHVDTHMRELLGAAHGIEELAVTGLHHEMQHQELMLTDILHALSFNPLYPALCPATRAPDGDEVELRMHSYPGGDCEIGAPAQGFSYDCEQPRHRVLLQPYRLANRAVNNAEWLAFMADGGYTTSTLWLADGWETCQRNQWRAPLYWRELDGEWFQFGLDGLQPLNFAAPVCHISYYEADAFARWAGKRLPSEQEWEHSAADLPIDGNFLENGFIEKGTWRPAPAISGAGASQLYGDVWEWTRSPYMPYPGFQPKNGALQEYNGKFMVNQFVLRGGSCATPRRQLRASYRNFFHPHQRWQFSGLRLAED